MISNVTICLCQLLKCRLRRSEGNLRGEVVLLQLPTLPQVPGANGVVQASGPQLGAIVGDVDTAGSVRVTLELPVGHTSKH